MSLHATILKSTLRYLSIGLLAISAGPVAGQQRRVAEGGTRAVVVDERLAVILEAPDLSANLLRRISRGRTVAVKGAKRSPDGVIFYRVSLTKRTGGWIQSEAVASLVRKDDDERLLRLIDSSNDFDRIVRARIFLDMFQKSPLRPRVLLIYGEAVEKVAARLSHDAIRRLDQKEMEAGGGPTFSYYLSYNGLDRYRRQGIVFLFDRVRKQFHYDGASWREVVRRYPRSPEAEEARRQLETLSTIALK